MDWRSGWATCRTSSARLQRCPLFFFGRRRTTTTLSPDKQSISRLDDPFGGFSFVVFIFHVEQANAILPPPRPKTGLLMNAKSRPLDSRQVQQVSTFVWTTGAAGENSTNVPNQLAITWVRDAYSFFFCCILSQKILCYVCKNLIIRCHSDGIPKDSSCCIFFNFGPPIFQTIVKVE